MVENFHLIVKINICEAVTRNGGEVGSLAATTATETSPENKLLENGGYFRNYCCFLASFIVDRARCKYTGRSAVEVNKRMKDLLLGVVVKTLNVEISRCHLADYVKEFCTKVPAARGARLFFHIEPIRSLFSGVVVAVAIA